jgi:hypothetical protein
MLAAWGAGCVIPVGPQFQDPLAARNLPPRIAYTDPPQGVPTNGLNFTITVADDNSDVLHVRWIFDFPPYHESTRRLPDIPVSGTPTPKDLPTMQVSCLQLAPNSAEDSLGRHLVMVVVADRPFVDDPEKPDQVTAEGMTDTAYWTLNHSCPPTR